MTPCSSRLSLLTALALLGCGRVNYAPRTGVDTAWDAAIEAGPEDARGDARRTDDTGIDAPEDTGRDGAVDTGIDAPEDTGRDGAIDTGPEAPIDGGRDAGVDAFASCACSPDATCVSGACVCNPGTVGDGRTCVPGYSSYETSFKGWTTGRTTYGWSVALSDDGTTLAIGAPEESSGGAGVGSGPTGSSPRSGAVLVYRRMGFGWVLEAYVKAIHPGEEDRFGSSVGLSGDGNRLIVGAPLEDGSGTGIDPVTDESAATSGAAYLYERSGSTWRSVLTLKASNTGVGDLFGSSVAISRNGEHIVIGAPGENGSSPTEPNDLGDRCGAAYTYDRASGGSWTLGRYLKASNPGNLDGFGTSVAIAADGRTLLVGAPAEDCGCAGVLPETGAPIPDELGADSGAAYLFEQTAAGAMRVRFFKPNRTFPGANFGLAVSLDRSGTVAAAGGSGIVCTYSRSPDWTLSQTFDSMPTTQFGTALALRGDGRVLAVGAFWDTTPGAGIGGSSTLTGSTGSVYVYTRDAGPYTLQTLVKAPSPGLDDWFGRSLALSGDGSTLVVSSLFEDSLGMGIGTPVNELGTDSGAVYTYR